MYYYDNPELKKLREEKELAKALLQDNRYIFKQLNETLKFLDSRIDKVSARLFDEEQYNHISSQLKQEKEKLLKAQIDL